MLHRLIIVFFLNMLAAMSPGPDFAIVLGNTLKKGRLAGIATAFGIACALIIHCSYCSLGLAHLITLHPVIMKIVSVIGGLYLFYMGSMIIKNRKHAIPSDPLNTLENHHKNHASFIEGFLTCMLNPKVIMFMVALFSTVIQPTSIEEGYLFACVIVVPSLIWFICLSCFLTIPKTKAKLFHIQHHILLVMGLILLVIGMVVLIEFFSSLL